MLGSLEKYMHLRERIKPYLMEQMKIASEDGTPVIRPLLYDFCTDDIVYNIGDEYMFGPDLLVAPVVEKGVTQRKVYLPKGASWTNAKMGERFEGGVWIEAEANLDIIPLYFKNDAILPVNIE
jgi:alpha-D-xyloside xylohydrolase